MKRILGVLAVLLVAASIPALASVPLARTPSAAGSSSGETIFQFQSMVGVSGAFLGNSMPLRGVNGGGLPWVIAKGEASLDGSGELQVEVQGLVLDPANPTAQSLGIAGTNPAPFFFATVSCLSTTGAVVNTDTATVSATRTGDAEIQQVLTLPSTCIGPIVLVRGSFTGASVGPWFAASGF